MKNRTCSMASWARRPGRNPYEVGQKSASKIGSSTSLAAVCTILSRTVAQWAGSRRISEKYSAFASTAGRQLVRRPPTAPYALVVIRGVGVVLWRRTWPRVRRAGVR